MKLVLDDLEIGTPVKVFEPLPQKDPLHEEYRQGSGSDFDHRKNPRETTFNLYWSGDERLPDLSFEDRMKARVIEDPIPEKLSDLPFTYGVASNTHMGEIRVLDGKPNRWFESQELGTVGLLEYSAVIVVGKEELLANLQERIDDYASQMEEGGFKGIIAARKQFQLNHWSSRWKLNGSDLTICYDLAIDGRKYGPKTGVFAMIPGVQSNDEVHPFILRSDSTLTETKAEELVHILEGMRYEAFAVPGMALDMADGLPSKILSYWG
tara:strand:+ start:3599 stop:4396 length:798 start_codon:yes stop_codon:yes gene_type:complete